jgi:hypothetical protein
MQMPMPTGRDTPSTKASPMMREKKRAIKTMVGVNMKCSSVLCCVNDFISPAKKEQSLVVYAT